MMTVEPIKGEPLRFLVSSEEYGRAPYLVDLGSYDGNGECACPHFQIKLKPKLDDKTSDDLQCKHIKRAYIDFGREMARRIVRHLAEKNKHPEQHHVRD